MNLYDENATKKEVPNPSNNVHDNDAVHDTNEVPKDPKTIFPKTFYSAFSFPSKNG